MRKSLLVLGCSLLMLGAVAAWWYLQSVNTGQEELRALQLVREANAALENENYSVGVGPDGKHRFGFDEAIPRYEELKQRYPEQTLPYRNLTIARVLKLTASDSQDGGEEANADTAVDESQQKRSAQEDAISAWEALASRDDGPITHWLQGYILDKAGAGKRLQPKIVEEYLAAARMAPEVIEYWFSVINAINGYNLTMPEARAEAVENLQRLSGKNLYVVMEVLSLAATRNPKQVGQVLEENQAVLDRANLTIQQYRGSDSPGGNIDDNIAALKQAIADQQWDRLPQLVTELKNVVKSKDPYKTAINRLAANPLDFLAWEFSEDLQERVVGARSEFAADRSPVSFDSIRLINNESPTEIGFSLVDVDFDGVLDAVTIQDTTLRILQGPLTRSDPPVLMEQQLDQPGLGILAGYLLQIADTGSGIDQSIRDSNQVPDAVAHAELPQIMVWGEAGLQVLDLTWTAEGGYVANSVSQPDSVQSLTKIREVICLDYDQDADLDLAVATADSFHLLMNRADNTFVDSTGWSSENIGQESLRRLQIVDWDRDLDIDLLGLDPQGKLILLENQLFGNFKKVSLSPTQPSEIQDFSVADFDGNASWDLLVDGTIHFTETRDWGDVRFLGQSDLLQASSGPLPDWMVGDFNNDMALDLVRTGDPTQATLGELSEYVTANGTQRYQVEKMEPGSRQGYGLGDQADLDGDGLLDLIESNGGQLMVYRNTTQTSNHWLSVIPRGRGDNVSKVSHLAIGALLEVRVGNRYYAETVTRPAVHVGLGSANQADVARIIWPNGIPQSLLLTSGDQRVDMLYILKGSCPFIYVWGEKGWEFLSDCLWAAPIGLQSPDQGLVPTRNWEYLRIPPGKLVPEENTYRILLTEELWETAYFDHVRLQVVDHPIGTQVHINDKVGPPSIVPHRLYLVDESRSPVRATDSHDRDVTDLIAAEDQRYFKGFQNRKAQGFVDSHWIELDLGERLSEDSTLFLTGWIQPTDTSINVLLQQHPGTRGPEFPVMEVIGADGKWKTVDRPMGFPGGKTKTMTVPLAGIFPTADHRLRIRTSCEIYWDHIYLAETPEKAAESLQVSECDLEWAELRFRGTSRRLPLHRNGPERFDARDVSPVSVWPPVSGPFTVYGPATDLVGQADDRMVIMGTGDALELRFSVPQPAGKEMERTFVFYSVGYDKDADLNTLAGQDSRPLPFTAMPQYPAVRGSDIEDQHLRDSRAVRNQSWRRFWKQIQNPGMNHQVQESKIPVGSATMSFRPE